jgi:cobalt/nickel transport system permease protein
MIESAAFRGNTGSRPAVLDARAALFLLVLLVVLLLTLPLDARMLVPVSAIVAAATHAAVLKRLLRRLALVLPMTAGIAIWVLFRVEGESMLLQSTWLKVSSEALQAAVGVASRMTAIAAASLLFGLLVPMRELVDGLRTLRLPERMISVAWMTERFFALLTADARRMFESIRARSIRLSLAMNIRVSSNIARTFITRAVARSEHLADALLLRGFDGSIPTAGCATWSRRDTLCCCVGLAMLLLLWIP